jgi:hypothetical protein
VLVSGYKNIESCIPLAIAVIVFFFFWWGGGLADTLAPFMSIWTHLPGRVCACASMYTQQADASRLSNSLIFSKQAFDSVIREVRVPLSTVAYVALSGV